MEWVMPSGYDFHLLECGTFNICISTRAQKDIQYGRACKWNVFMQFPRYNYGYVQVNREYVGTLDEAKLYAESILHEIKEGIPV